MMTETEKRKKIARLLKQGLSDDEIRSQLGPTKAKAAKLQPEGEDISPFENSPIYGLPFGIGDNPLVANKLREGLDRLIGTISAPDAGIAKAAKSGNPLDFLSGTFENIGARSTEQESLSEALGRPDDTLGQAGSNFMVDVLGAPSTYMGGAGILKNIAKGAGRGVIKSGTKALGKKAVKLNKPKSYERILRQQLDAITPRAFSATATPEDIAEYQRLNVELSKLLMK